MHRHLERTFLTSLGLLLTFASFAGASNRAVLEAASPELENVALGLPLDGSLRLEGLALESEGAPATLELQRFRVFTSDAKVVVHAEGGDISQPAPKNAYFRGVIEGAPGSRAVISVLEVGGVRGLVSHDHRIWMLGNAKGARGAADTLTVREIGDSELFGRPFQCDAESLPEPPEPAMTRQAALRQTQIEESLKQGSTYSARVAVETDNEYLALFGGDTTAATNYIGDLAAFSSVVYDDEAALDWLIPSVSLWPGPDPWTQTGSGTLCMLLEFGRYWNDNNPMPGTPVRSNATFLSGFNSGGGIAWRPSMCDPGFVYNHAGSCPGLSPLADNYGGSYGYSGGIDGDFDLNNPTMVWDIVVFMHENGHNMGSRHTHCYAGIGGHSDPVDQCYAGENGCYSGPTSLPAGCPGSGNQCGTIMSYCHLQPGGLSNIALTLGAPAGGHPYGVEPERVPEAITAYIASRAAAFPGCLDRVGEAELIFEDGFETGDTTLWSTE